MSFRIRPPMSRVYCLQKARTYATVGVHHEGDVLSVFAPRAPDAIEIFTSQKQGSREATVEKLESALLRAQLNRHNRKLVFCKRSNSLWGAEEPRSFLMRLGFVHKEMKLEPRPPVGPLAMRDLRTIAFTPQSADEVRESVNLLVEFVNRFDKIPGALGQLVVDKKIVDPQVFSGLLRRSAELGIFEEVYRNLQVKVGDQLTPEFFVEALRIYALRVPFLSSRSNAVLTKLYSHADNASLESGARFLLYAYGLKQYALKFGDAHVKTQYEGVLAQIKEKFIPAAAPSPRRTLKYLTVSDLVLGLEAVKGTPLESEMAAILERVQGDKPVTEAYTVDISDRAAEGEVKDSESEEK